MTPWSCSFQGMCQAVKTRLQQTICSQLAIEKPSQEQQIPSEPDRLRNHYTPSRPDLSVLSLPLKTARCLEEHQLKGLQNNCHSQFQRKRSCTGLRNAMRAEYLEVDYQHSDHILLKDYVKKDPAKRLNLKLIFLKTAVRL